MTIAYWCVFFAILMPLIFTGIAKFSGRGFLLKDNLAPREFLDRLEGARKRANWTQMNTHESIPGFMAAVVIAHQMNGDQNLIDILAVSYIVLRLLYGALYIANKGMMRTVIWALGLLCTLALFFTASV